MKSPTPRVIPIQPLFKADPKIHPRSISGPYTRVRWVFVWLTQIAFYGLCWLPWNGRQALLFDLEERRFFVFDLVLWPQDTIYLALLLVLAALALFLFTTVAGRLWCGYTCPQTVYTEMFLWLESLIEGDRPKRMKLDAAPWTLQKVGIKVAKHGAWLLLSLWTGFTFVAYFTPARELIANTLSASLGPWEAFWVIFYAIATYGNAGFMREQMCKYICPYARFQFVMLDRDSLVISYDESRGDPRGARSRRGDPATMGLGDCVDCGICVQVCPTGIDIRNGLQNECIGCAACIDGCDQVMEKMGYPKGLIRYSTENALESKLTRAQIIRRALRPRTLVYSAVFLALVSGTAWSLSVRLPLKVSIQRDRASLGRELDDGSIENVYRLQLFNASEKTHKYRIRVEGLPNLAITGNAEVEVPPASHAMATSEVRLAEGGLQSGARKISFLVSDIDDPAVKVEVPATFLIP